MRRKKLPSIFCRATILRATIAIMLVQSTSSLRVAVLGSGVAGSTAARALAERGVKVTVFEAGFGIGGRTSTRITRDENQYQFDHGAQYISTPKTELFQEALDQWKKDGWVKNWSGSFCTVGKSGVIDMESRENQKERYVGYPTMNSICRNLLKHENINVQTQTRANALRQDEEDGNLGSINDKWQIIHAKTKKNLGDFDWLIVTDRNSGAHYRRDLINANVNEFRSGIRSIKSVKSLTAMVVFEKPLGLGLDGVQFENYEKGGSSLGWAARDTSKPGRERKDGKECWVLQSHPDAANHILKEIGTKKIDKIRDKAREVLLQDFLASAEILAKSTKNDKCWTPPLVETSIGHRWGAAFPIPSQKYVDMDSQTIADKKFVACGDYFGKLSGRIEGAWLSGFSAAKKLCELEELIE